MITNIAGTTHVFWQHRHPRRGLGKRYAIGGPQEKYLTLRDAIVNSVKAPFVRFHHIPTSEEFWALKGCFVWCGAGRGCRDYRAELCGEVNAAIRFIPDNCTDRGGGWSIKAVKHTPHIINSIQGTMILQSYLIVGDFSSGRSGRMTKTVNVVFDGSVFRPSGPVNLKAGKNIPLPWGLCRKILLSSRILPLIFHPLPWQQISRIFHWSTTITCMDCRNEGVHEGSCLFCKIPCWQICI